MNFEIFLAEMDKRQWIGRRCFTYHDNNIDDNGNNITIITPNTTSTAK